VLHFLSAWMNIRKCLRSPISDRTFDVRLHLRSGPAAVHLSPTARFESHFFHMHEERTTRFSASRRGTTCYFLPSSSFVTTSPAKLAAKYGIIIVSRAMNCGAL
jgi:hypothetical protein